MKYSLKNLKKNGHLFIPAEEHKREILGDVGKIRIFLELASQYTEKFPEIFFSDEAIQFYIPNFDYNGRTQYCAFKKEPNTPTGKPPKYPIILLYHIGKTGYSSTFDFSTSKKVVHDVIFGNIHYLENGEIGKIKIITWASSICRVIEVLKKKNQELHITKIIENGDESNDFKKIVLYSDKT